MHIHGFSYKDANFGGIHYNKATGKVIIVDVDNTTFAGNPENKSNVYFPGLGAPEVVRGEPCTPESDLHSLACMLYVLLVRDYPFEGKATESVRLFNDAAHKKFYANSPVFVYHPTDNSNGPSATLNKSSMVYWPRLPQELRDMFIRTFVDGLTDPTKRPRSFEWVSVITDVINSMYPCNHCSTIVYYRPENLNADKTHKCTRCAKNSTLPIIFALPKNKFIFVTPSTSITVGSYLAGSASADAVVAQVVENPAKPGVYGLRNETDAVWTLTKTDGNTLDIPPGRAAPLLLGSVIKGFVANAEFTCAIKRVGE
jgi:DNA-binding helix-hairpin-helix protein with protein kinase domain